MLIVYRVLYALLQISRVDMRRKFLLDERESGRWEMGEKMEREVAKTRGDGHF